MFYTALDKVNWSQPKMEKLYVYVKAYNSIEELSWELSCGEIK